MDKPEELKRKIEKIHHMPLAWWLFHLDVADTIDVYEVDGSGDAEAACHAKALYTGSPVDWLSENGKALLALAARPRGRLFLFIKIGNRNFRRSCHNLGA